MKRKAKNLKPRVVQPVLVGGKRAARVRENAAKRAARGQSIEDISTRLSLAAASAV